MFLFARQCIVYLPVLSGCNAVHGMCGWCMRIMMMIGAGTVFPYSNSQRGLMQMICMWQIRQCTLLTLMCMHVCFVEDLSMPSRLHACVMLLFILRFPATGKLILAESEC